MRFGDWRRRMTLNTIRATSTAQAKKSSMKPMKAAVADAGDGEVLLEQVSVGLDDREDEDGEAPEREGVREARARST